MARTLGLLTGAFLASRLVAGWVLLLLAGVGAGLLFFTDPTWMHGNRAMIDSWISPRRVGYALSLVVVSSIGIISRVLYFDSLLIDKYLGDVVYAVVFYLFLALVWVRGRPGTKAAWILAFVLAVELFQLTLIPWRMSQSDSFFLRFVSILLGTKFSLLDVVAYLVGVAGIYLTDRVYRDRPV